MDVITIKTTFNKYIFQKYYKIRNFWGDLAPEIFIKKDIALSEVTGYLYGFAKFVTK